MQTWSREGTPVDGIYMAWELFPHKLKHIGPYQIYAAENSLTVVYHRYKRD